MIGLAEATLVAWPLAATLAWALVAERRRARRRRTAIEIALHELRRPLHLLALTRTAGAPARDLAGPTAGAQLEAAIAALEELDAAVDGAAPERRPAAVSADLLAREALGRWAAPAGRCDRGLELRCGAGEAAVDGDPDELGRALDNLVANALEHGAHPVRIEAATAGARLRLAVVDGEPARPREGQRDPPVGVAKGGDDNPRRGHGLELVSRTAARHGGQFALDRDEHGARAVLELPLAVRVPQRGPAGPPAGAA